MFPDKLLIEKELFNQLLKLYNKLLTSIEDKIQLLTINLLPDKLLPKLITPLEIILFLLRNTILNLFITKRLLTIVKLLNLIDKLIEMKPELLLLELQLPELLPELKLLLDLLDRFITLDIFNLLYKEKMLMLTYKEKLINMLLEIQLLELLNIDMLLELRMLMFLLL